MRPKKPLSPILYVVLIGLLVLSLLVFSIVSVVTQPPASSSPSLFGDCTDGRENAELTCNNGADFAHRPLPRPQPPLMETIPPIPYRGVSLAGGEFEGPLAPSGAFLPYANDAAIFLHKGMNTFRVPIAWEYFADIHGVINAEPTYLARLDAVIGNLTSVVNATVIIDVHNYMRYNPTNIGLNTQRTDPLGSDVIGIGHAAPTTAAFATLWSNIAARYSSPRILYALMNEPHDISFDLLVTNTNAALQAIRRQEGGGQPHLVLISGNNWTGLHSWFSSTSSNDFYNGNDALFLNRLQDPANHFAIEVHQYFDADSSGTYGTGNCVPTDVFNATFDAYWALFTAWSRKHQLPVLLGEFGVVDTPTCISDATHLMDALTTFENTIGWVVWAAGNSWGSYILSVAQSGPANPLMNNHILYENYLEAHNDTLPPLNETPIAILIINDSSENLHYGGGYLPPQFVGSADIRPRGGVGILYSNNNYTTPTGNLQLKYFTRDPALPLGVGFQANQDNGISYSYAWSKPSDVVSIHPSPSPCPIVITGPAGNPTDFRCYRVVNK